MNYRYGLKLWSTNENYVAAARSLHAAGHYHFIELYIKPGSYADCLHFWRDLEIPFVIHAPHFGDGVNLARAECEERNRELLAETRRFGDELRAEQIIIHPGVEGEMEETARQILLLTDSRFIIENKPYYSVDGKLVCVGSTPAEMKFLLKESGRGFCFDFGHAIAAAVSLQLNCSSQLEQFNALNPQLYHLSDGDPTTGYDDHLHPGQGNFDLAALLEIIPPDAPITVESDKDSTENLDDFVRDLDYLKELSRRSELSQERKQG